MRVWATTYIVLHEPGFVQGPQDAQHAELWPGVEDVVNDTLNGVQKKGDLRFANVNLKSKPHQVFYLH